MSTRAERARKRALAAGALCLLSASAVGGCGKTGPARGGLMLIVSSDGPLSLDRLDIDVSSKNKSLLSNEYRLPQEASLPTTVAIVSNGDATAIANIDVTGWEAGVPLDRREAIVTQIPTDHVATLSVVLSGRCSDKLTVGADGKAQSTCAAGNSCNSDGDCAPTPTVIASDLPVYHPGDETDAGVAGASSNGGSDGGRGAMSTAGAADSGGSAMTVAGGSGVAGAAQDPCLGKQCNTPPSSDCESGTQFKAYDKQGSCAKGLCSYTSHLIACACQAGACTVDPCAAVTCNTPPAALCKTAATATSYSATGTCSAGTCSYTPKDTDCGSNKVCIAGVCSECKTDTSCGTACAACMGTTPKCKDLGTTSQCVGCLSDLDCTGGWKCDTTSNTCVQPSCVGVAAICGPNGSTSCCASSVVTGTTAATSPPFYRSYDGLTNVDKSYPATVSDFRLDTYEITVGRFRKFWNDYPGDTPAAGSGKNPNNPGDPGWDASWNASSLPTSKVDLTTSISCGGYQTWTAGNDALPMNCLDWFVAEAFCIWDGGRLPTEAEWNYAASGGTAQLAYPWGNAVPDCTYANFDGAAGGTDFCAAPTGVGGVKRVGSQSPKGDGLFGQADLSGNVWEWVQDWSAPYTVACNNCADLSAAAHRVLRGGGFGDSPPRLLAADRTYHDDPAFHDGYGGARCARAR
jgi:sulfatase modifying factor 1